MKFIQTVLNSILITLVGLFFGGCVYEYNNCNELNTHTITPTIGDSVDLGTIKDVTIYVFDDNQKFIDSIGGKINTPLAIQYSDYEYIYLVSITNKNSNRFKNSFMKKGDLLKSCYIQLSNTNVNNKKVADIPYDTFYGLSKVDLNKDISTEEPYRINHVLPLVRKVCYLKLDLVGLQPIATKSLTDYSIYIGQSPSIFKFDDTYQEPLVYYNPPVSFDATSNTYSTPVFYTFPNAVLSKSYLQIYKNDQLIYETDSDTNPSLKWDEGKITEIKISFSEGKATITSNISLVSEWESSNQVVPF